MAPIRAPSWNAVGTSPRTATRADKPMMIPPPCSRQWRAIASPIPRAPPVTRTVLPVRSTKSRNRRRFLDERALADERERDARVGRVDLAREPVAGEDAVGDRPGGEAVADPV